MRDLPIPPSAVRQPTTSSHPSPVPEPAKAVADVARTLKPGGRIIIGDMLPHDRESYRQQMGHVWLGFSDDHINRMLSEAGLGRIRTVSLTPDARAKGPGLFVATAQKQM